MNYNVLKGPLTVSFEITNQCMLSCLHCYNRSGNDLKRNELDDETAIKIATELRDLKIFSFCFCGGEPLLRYELLIKMANILKETCPNINMVTNGYLLTREKIIELKKSGIKLIQISMDGAKSETHNYMRGKEDSFERIMENLKILNEFDINVNIAFSPTNFNIDEFPSLVRMLNKFKNIDTIRVQPLMLLGRGSINNIVPTEKQYRELVNFIDEYQTNKKFNEIKIDWGDPIDHLIRFSGEDFIQTTFTEIKSDGSILVSSYLPVCVGNLKKYTLSKYWENGLYKAWKIPIIRQLANEYSSISKLGGSINNSPKMFFDKNIEIDLIDNKIFENLEHYTLEKFLKGAF